MDKRPSTLVTLFVLAEAGTLAFYPVNWLTDPSDNVVRTLIGVFVVSGVLLPAFSLALWRTRRLFAITGLITFGLALLPLIFRL